MLVVGDLTWEEQITVCRLRVPLTKQELADRVGVTRTWLWRGLEAGKDHQRRVELSSEIKMRIEQVLTEALAEAAARDAEDTAA